MEINIQKCDLKRKCRFFRKTANSDYRVPLLFSDSVDFLFLGKPSVFTATMLFVPSLIKYALPLRTQPQSQKSMGI